jgi:hypothetical protein
MGSHLSDGRRDLSHGELQVVKQVFRDTIPYNSVVVINKAGFGGRPFTIPNPGFEDRGPTYHLNVGAGGFTGMDGSPQWRGYLVHELTHVWQACHSTRASAYVFDSIWHQITSPDAYKYSPGQPWSSYNAEQQASIVEDWFNAGQSEAGPLFPYIRDHIRATRRVR